MQKRWGCKKGGDAKKVGMQKRWGCKKGGDAKKVGANNYAWRNDLKRWGAPVATISIATRAQKQPKLPKPLKPPARE
jgi:hypothetical protein